MATPDRTSESPALNSDVVVGENIAARRRCLGWTRAKLGEVMQQSDSWVRRVEEGQKLSPIEFYAIAEALSVSEPRVLLRPGAFY
jgi:transcriptional regulator with XRE-family HTH domain